jgi:1,4-alpha-glucan branching enzyme
MKTTTSSRQYRLPHPTPPPTSKTVEPSALLHPEAPTPRALLAKGFPESAVGVATFHFLSLNAREVFVAGSFNAWQPRATPLTQQSRGKWSARVELGPGTYEYRFVVDGQWQEDPRAVRSKANPYGGLNSVVDINSAQG